MTDFFFKFPLGKKEILPKMEWENIHMGYFEFSCSGFCPSQDKRAGI